MAATPGISIHHTTAYHPQSNFMIERFNKSLKASLCCHLSSGSWLNHLQWVLLGLHSAVNPKSDCSPASMMFRHSVLLPGEHIKQPNLPFLRPPLPLTILPHAGSHPDLILCLRTLSTYVPCGSSQPPYRRPYRVLQCHEKCFKLSISDVPQWVSVNRLKPSQVPGTDPNCVATRSGLLLHVPAYFQGAGSSCSELQHSVMCYDSLHLHLALRGHICTLVSA